MRKNFQLLLVNLLVAGNILAEDLPITPGPFITWTAPLCGEKVLAVQPFIFLRSYEKEFSDEGNLHDLANATGKKQIDTQMFIQYGISRHLEIDATLDYQINSYQSELGDATGDGLGDLPVVLRFCPPEENKNYPHLTFLFGAILPSGKFENGDPGKFGTDLTGGGSLDYSIGLNLSKYFSPFYLHLDYIYSLPQKATIDGQNVQYGNYHNFDFGLEYIFARNFNVLVETNFYYQKDTADNPENYWRKLGLGVGYSQEKYQALVGYLIDIMGKNVEQEKSLVATLIYSF